MTSRMRNVAQGQHLASGRESDVYLRPDGLLVKRARTGRDLRREAALMQYLQRCDVPVPRVHDATEHELVMEYVPGPRMSEEVGARPWRAGSLGRTLAGLHRRLDDVCAPDFLDGEGQLLHFDLHPGNVVMGPDGPVVLDWACATRGDRKVDVALSWLAMAVAKLRPTRSVARWRFLKSFLAEAGSVAEAIPEAAEIRLARHDRDDEEREAVRKLVAHYRH